MKTSGGRSNSRWVKATEWGAADRQTCRARMQSPLMVYYKTLAISTIARVFLLPKMLRFSSCRHFVATWIIKSLFRLEKPVDLVCSIFVFVLRD